NAGTTMSEVVASVKRVTDIMSEISAASLEQSSGVSQIGEAITQMDQVTQQNAALVEESAAAAGSLRQQAQELVSAVATFKLAQGSRHPIELAPTDRAHALADRRGPDRAQNVTRLPLPLGAHKKDSAETQGAHPVAQERTGTDHRIGHH
ncbi:MAG TPA: methyl-accepting chemotaxis protein, partial [Burkholderiaceae bacterium]|nr:methyl-accepting chemotaxis protein [Burkholderiaceae bacterium]